MASYNGAAFVGAQLDSFTTQTRQPDELVICDDGSTDDTLAIIDDFARRAPFDVRLQRNSERLGYSLNFEKAILLCRGDIIFLSDQDDRWSERKVATVAMVFSQNPKVQVVVNDQEMAGAALEPSGITKLENLRRIGKENEGLIEGCCTAIRKEWAQLTLPIPRDRPDWIASNLLSYDRWLNELAILLGVRAVVDEPLQLFRRHGANATDWIASEPRRIRDADLFATRLSTVPVEEWQQRIDLLQLYRRWIDEHAQQLAKTGIGDSAHARGAISHEQESIAARIALTAMPLPRRVRQIAELWLNGGYRYFFGWKSAARDLVRTR